MSKKNAVLENLKKEMQKAEREAQKRQQEYLQEMYRRDVEIISNAFMENIGVLEDFVKNTGSDKTQIAKMYAEYFPVFYKSDEVQSMLVVSATKRKEGAERRRARKREKKAEQTASGADCQPAQSYQQQVYGTGQHV